MEEARRAVISLSGGLDSTCLLMHLLAQGYRVKAYSFNYGQKHTVELEKVKKNIEFLQSLKFQVEHQIINLEDVFSDNTSSLVKSTGKEIPEGNYNEENMKSTVVPIRNVIFSSIIYSKALNWAIKDNAYVDITLGLHAGDHFIYPDCRPESQEACRRAFQLSDENSHLVNYIAPFIKIDKASVLAMGIQAMEKLSLEEGSIKRILENTHTCYNPDEHGRSCGKCGSCRERLEAFELNGMQDPIEYR